MDNVAIKNSPLAGGRFKSTQLKWESILFLSLAVGLGFVYAWTAASSHSMNADGISYLDMGDT
jgi:hypothetical protein